MIIDQFNVFFDNTPVEASADSPGVNMPPHAGRNGPVTVLLNGANAAPVNMNIALQESDDNINFTSVSAFTLAKPDEPGAMLAFTLPGPARKKFVRLSYTLTGAPAGLIVFAAITRDHFAPCSEGQFIDRGRAIA
jgi:hypothetical protein